MSLVIFRKKALRKMLLKNQGRTEETLSEAGMTDIVLHNTTIDNVIKMVDDLIDDEEE